MMSVLGDKKRASEFFEIAEKLKYVQISISNGKKIDLLKLDPPVTPVLILGYNEEERQKSKYPPMIYHLYNRIQWDRKDLWLKIRRIEIKRNKAYRSKQEGGKERTSRAFKARGCQMYWSCEEWGTAKDPPEWKEEKPLVGTTSNTHGNCLH